MLHKLAIFFWDIVLRVPTVKNRSMQRSISEENGNGQFTYKNSSQFLFSPTTRIQLKLMEIMKRKTLFCFIISQKKTHFFLFRRKSVTAYKQSWIFRIRLCLYGKLQPQIFSQTTWIGNYSWREQQFPDFGLLVCSVNKEGYEKKKKISLLPILWQTTF